MRVLLDECVPHPLCEILIGHHCTSVKDQGWGGIKNGELLRLAEGRFDVFITADQNIRYQQNLSGRQIAIVELSTNDLRRILAVSSLLISVVETTRTGEFLQVEIP
jgi:hypothetical protein